jgi:hypothetical protein
MTHIIRGPNYGNVSAGNYATFGMDGTLQLAGSATAFDDLRVEGATARTGAVAPNDTNGFRGDNNHQVRYLIDSQADEVQFYVQFMHGLKIGAACYPHVHFSPSTTGTGTAQFILEYYWANVGAQFPASPGTYTMTKTWATNQQWYHLIATGAAPLTLTDVNISAIIKCRLYRDNTVGGNYAASLALLYFDIHVEIDAFGSAEEYAK